MHREILCRLKYKLFGLPVPPRPFTHNQGSYTLQNMPLLLMLCSGVYASAKPVLH